MGAREGECWGVCAQWEGVHVRESAGVYVLSGRGYIPWVYVRESAGVLGHAVPSGRGNTIGACEGECWGVSTCCAYSGKGYTMGEVLASCDQWERLYVHVPLVHVRESAGVLAHAVPSRRGYTIGAREGECWGVCTHCASGRGYTVGAREGECWDPCTHCAGLYHGCT